MTLGELYGHPLPGADAGRCYVCGAMTEHGWREAPSGTFTAWALCYSGTVQCEHCRSLLKNNRFRFYSWVLTPDGLQVRGKEDKTLVWRTLQNPPQGMWAIYQTTGGQKQGWIGIAQAVNESRATYRVGVDWLDRPVLMTLLYVQDHAPVIDSLRAEKIAPDSLRSGSWSMLDYRRAMDAKLEAEYRIAVQQAGKPEWEVLVNAHSIG